MREKRDAYRFWWGNLRERDHLEDPGLDGRIILKWIFRKWDGSIYWIDLAQNRDGWRALVNVVMLRGVSSRSYIAQSVKGTITYSQ
jgi:hypothetical protein